MFSREKGCGTWEGLIRLGGEKWGGARARMEVRRPEEGPRREEELDQADGRG